MRLCDLPVIGALFHDWQPWQRDLEDPSKQSRKCFRCWKTEIIPYSNEPKKHVHDWGDWVDITINYYNENGITGLKTSGQVRYCKKCNFKEIKKKT